MSDPILDVVPLGMHWPTLDPFLFCAYHNDAYPAGNERLGPATSLAGRQIGQDFDPSNAWRMYHGDVVPGFPQHPHRGFETITYVRKGIIDHHDSMGAMARFGRGDTQWMTAGRGVVHSEMFPLLHRDGDNPLELFQIWLNLPAADKMVEPHFAMFWSEEVPRQIDTDSQGRQTEVTIVAGAYGEQRPLAPPPHSWAARADSQVAIWTIKMQPEARWTLPAAPEGTHRGLYLFDAGSVRVGGRKVAGSHGVFLRGDAEVELVNGKAPAEMMLLQGRPIAEPVAQYGPFVMNSRAEIQQAFQDYQRTRFGGWPYPDDAPTHGPTQPRFARHADGRVEERS